MASSVGSDEFAAAEQAGRQPYQSARTLFLSFLKIGALLYGGGYVLLAFLRGDFVDAYGWITNQQLLDAVAVGQFTPGPLFTTATFVGYLIAGFPGAVVATIGIFLPSFIFVAITNPLIPKMRQSSCFGVSGRRERGGGRPDGGGNGGTRHGCAD